MTDGALVLIVEDNEKNLKLARDLLWVKGFRTLEARTAEEGLELARAHLPKLVLMDVQLPGMDGFAALRALRADPATVDLIVVAFTASVMTEDVARVEEAGFDGFIAKPIAVREFPDQVARFLDHR
ncbi:MAG TPA: response regulator [Chloroflexota bacterium]|nr:response regulator [Chloroflexota bacterium]